MLHEDMLDRLFFVFFKAVGGMMRQNDDGIIRMFFFYVFQQYIKVVITYD